MLGGAVSLLIVLGIVLVSVAIDPEVPSPGTLPPSRTPSGTPQDSPSPSASPEPALANLRVRDDGHAKGFPAGWHRWTSSDGSFSFVVPPGSMPREASFHDDLWELTNRGTVLHIYLYVSDRYEIGVDPMFSLELIADDLARAGTELDRSTITSWGRQGLEIVYRDDAYRYLFISHLYAVRGRYFQVSAGYPELLDGSELRAQATTFLNSFRIRSKRIDGDSAVAGAS